MRGPEDTALRNPAELTWLIHDNQVRDPRSTDPVLMGKNYTKTALFTDDYRRSVTNRGIVLTRSRVARQMRPLTGTSRMQGALSRRFSG